MIRPVATDVEPPPSSTFPGEPVRGPDALAAPARTDPGGEYWRPSKKRTLLVSLPLGAVLIGMTNGADPGLEPAPIWFQVLFCVVFGIPVFLGFGRWFQALWNAFLVDAVPTLRPVDYKTALGLSILLGFFIT